MSDQTKSMMIGIFVLSAFAIVMFMMLFIHPNIGNEGKTIRVRFGDIDKITDGTRVTFAGKPVGEVTDIRELDHNDDAADGYQDSRIEHNGVIYVYELTLSIDSHVEIYTTDEITSRTSGLLGEKSVSIMPIPKPSDFKLVPVTDQVLYSTESGSVESTLRDIRNLAAKFEIALDGVINAFDTLKVGNTWENASFTLKNLADVTFAINKPQSLSNIITDLEKTINSAKEIVANVRSGKGSLGKFIYNNDIYDNTSSIFKKISKGEGTIGKFIHNDELYLRMASLFSKAEVILNDINHYGILFHQDKGWKRLRARRLNLMQELCSPQQFRNYFNDELDSIVTSIERVSLVMQRSDEVCPCGLLLHNPEYVKVYSELLRRVGTLEEYLEMYNQQVVDNEVRTVEFVDY